MAWKEATLDVEKAAAAFETTINQSCTTTDKTTEISKNELANLTQQYIQARQEVADKATVADRVILQATSWGCQKETRSNRSNLFPFCWW